MTKMKKAVILDFDGTLGDTCSLIVRTMHETLDELNLPQKSDEECAAMIGLPLKQTFTELMPMSDETGNMCEATYCRLFTINNKPGAVPLFPNVHDTIARLHSRGMILTIASSRLRASLEGYLRDLKLEEYISYIVSASDIERAKPSPDMVIKTLDAINVKPEETIVVGDTLYDIRMAHSAGVEAVGVTYGNGKREELEAEKAEYIIDDFKELLGIIS